MRANSRLISTGTAPEGENRPGLTQVVARWRQCCRNCGLSPKPNDSSLVGLGKRPEGKKMFSPIESRRDPFNPATRGYHAVYRENEVNHCPGCGRTHWFLGRLLAECAFCGTALPLQEGYRQGKAITVVAWSSPTSSHELRAA